MEMPIPQECQKMIATLENLLIGEKLSFLGKLRAVVASVTIYSRLLSGTMAPVSGKSTGATPNGDPASY